MNLQDLKTDSKAFFSLLLQAGYLTYVKKNLYKIPNFEIRKYFYGKLLPIWIDKKFSYKIDSGDKIIDQLAQNIDNKEDYKNTIQILLNGMNKGDKTEADFQALFGGAANLVGVDGRNRKHNCHSEVQNIYGNKLDHLFLPIKEKSDTVLIHEIKK
eukprot:GHVR01102446.1.p2 GENE.GHVR01102446.1~~GHVR01102446.1.p2  ORF type:complete len:156 (+),score=16.42 GHVR01102446.1:2464-2931(+)